MSVLIFWLLSACLLCLRIVGTIFFRSNWIVWGLWEWNPINVCLVLKKSSCAQQAANQYWWTVITCDDVYSYGGTLGWAWRESIMFPGLAIACTMWLVRELLIGLDTSSLLVRVRWSKRIWLYGWHQGRWIQWHQLAIPSLPPTCQIYAAVLANVEETCSWLMVHLSFCCYVCDVSLCWVASITVQCPVQGSSLVSFLKIIWLFL